MVKRIKDRVRGRIKNIIVYYTVVFIIPTIIVVGIVIYCVYSAYSYFMLAVVGSQQALDLFGEMEKIKTDDVKEVKKNEDEYPKYGVYPEDNSLRIKKEMLEICDAIGKIFNIKGSLIYAIAAVETDAYNLPVLERGLSGSLYTDLCIGNYKAADGKSFFVDGPLKGQLKDKAGNKIVDPLKVGVLRSDYSKSSVAKAIGPYQFWSSYLNEHVTKVFMNDKGNVTCKDGVNTISWFDDELGFMRPHPLYFPDAALNAASFIVSKMEIHKSQLNDIKSLNLPKEIEDEILFIYAADAYHGDTESSSKGASAKKLHDIIAELYADIFIKYKADGFISESLGDFSENRYHQASVRAGLAGVQFTTGGQVDFDGTYNHKSIDSEIKSDALGKYVELNGKKLYKSMITELSNKQPFNIDYRQIVVNMPATCGGTNSKFGWVYGFQGINAATYYWNAWMNEIADSFKADDSASGESIPSDGNLSETAYSLGDCDKWLTGDKDASKIAMGRLAKLAEDNSRKIHISSGYRSIDEQKKIANDVLKANKSKGYYMDNNGAVYNKAGNMMVAPPGGSRHQSGLAMDINDSWFEGLSNDYLKKYGLKKPMSYEPWHVEPIETSER